MRGVIVDPLPRGLRLWACDRCRRRQWFYDGDPIPDEVATRIAAQTDAALAALEVPAE